MFLKLGDREYRVRIDYDSHHLERRGVVVTLVDPEGVAATAESRIGKRETVPFNKSYGRWMAFRKALRAYLDGTGADADMRRSLWRGLSKAFAAQAKVPALHERVA